jgi:SAM-dependent methyltransferase
MSLASRAPTRVRTALGPPVERLLYQDRLYDDQGEPFVPGRFGRAMTRLNQALVERGTTPPWVWSRDECESYWRASGNGDEGNRPEDYAAKDRAIVGFLAGFWTPEIGTGDSVLEVGCNAGANLEGLREQGYGRLTGVEINDAALQELRRAFPELAAVADLRAGAANEVLAGVADDSIDVVFSMAVLLHVHPSSHEVLAQMVRIARRYVCVIEAETATAAYVFPRNYRRVFERLGCTEVRSVTLARSSHPEVGLGYFGYTARLLRVGP